MERRWLKISDAAEVYSLHPKTLFLLCAQNKIPHTRIPSARGGRGSVRVDRVGFDKLLEDGLVVPVERPSLDRRRRT